MPVLDQEDDLFDDRGESCPDCGAHFSEDHELDCAYVDDDDDDPDDDEDLSDEDLDFLMPAC